MARLSSPAVPITCAGSRGEDGEAVRSTGTCSKNRSSVVRRRLSYSARTAYGGSRGGIAEDGCVRSELTPILPRSYDNLPAHRNICAALGDVAHCLMIESGEY